MKGKRSGCTLFLYASGPRYLFALALFEALAFQVELVNANASASIDEITKMLKAAREDANG